MRVAEAVKILERLEPPGWLEGETPALVSEERGNLYYLPDGTLLVGEIVDVWRAIEAAKAEDPDNRLVHEWMLDGGYMNLSTVYLGLNHGYFPGSPIRIFETMIFGFGNDHFQWRYATRAAAHAGHELIRDVLAGILDDSGTDVTIR